MFAVKPVWFPGPAPARLIREWCDRWTEGTSAPEHMRHNKRTLPHDNHGGAENAGAAGLQVFIGFCHELVKTGNVREQVLFGNFHLARRREKRYTCGMYAAYHVRVDELNDKVVQTLKNIYRQGEIIILPQKAYTEIEKIRHNATFTEKLQRSMQDIEEGRGIVKTIAELEAMENE